MHRIALAVIFLCGLTAGTSQAARTGKSSPQRLLAKTRETLRFATNVQHWIGTLRVPEPIREDIREAVTRGDVKYRGPGKITIRDGSDIITVDEQSGGTVVVETKHTATNSSLRRLFRPAADGNFYNPNTFVSPEVRSHGVEIVDPLDHIVRSVVAKNRLLLALP
jgi:hypothetical protein